MTGNTHLSLGIVAGAITVAYQDIHMDVKACGIAILVASFGAILPDVDEDGSLLNNLLFRSIKYRSFALAFLGGVTAVLSLVHTLPLWVLLVGCYAMAVAFIPHRSFTHSFLSLSIVSGITYLANPALVPPMIAGYLSHLVADGMTAGGIPLLWPIKKRFGTKNIGFSIRSGDRMDQLIGKLAMYGGSLGLVYLLFVGISEESILELAKAPLQRLKSLF